ncbi:MAG: mercury resistance system transport protein MerF [Thermodesulfobacteriota bacterium]
MRRSRLLATGIVGSIIAALCCFTPVLLILFGVVGLAAFVGYLDYVLMPALVFFVALTVYAIMKKDNGKCCKRKREAGHE